MVGTKQVKLEYGKNRQTWRGGGKYNGCMEWYNKFFQKGIIC